MLKVVIQSVFALENGLSRRGIVRNYSFGSMVNNVKNYFALRAGTKPPYHHVCQVGDPVLRLQAEPVDLEVIPTAEFKKFIDHLITVMRSYEAYGLAAPQIGVPVQVFVIETTEKNYEENSKTMRAGQPLEIVPLRVFINPKMKIIDYKTFTYPEACVSICGYSAHVPRAKSIRIDALDLSGNPFVWNADGWPARIAQHEMDHLQGKVYTDKMDPKTFSCVVWDLVNFKEGKLAMDYRPNIRSKFK
ncbi:hypothetical protein PV328_006573 [Microctonus aethiopoides]|uniref:Peptide deformylase n=1 Tax=Microctonus aethiopoides TaxID=144406 RepID=A0AA39FPT7_9HYME|nr:hypothetical protein PV328_006573 [Microctonus aethiopoides]